MKKPICVELPTSLVDKAKIKAQELDIPLRKFIELALLEFLKQNVSIKIEKK